MSKNEINIKLKIRRVSSVAQAVQALQTQSSMPWVEGYTYATGDIGFPHAISVTLGLKPPRAKSTGSKKGSASTASASARRRK